VVGRIKPRNEVKGSRDIAAFDGWIFEFTIGLDIETHYVADMMVSMILIEEQKSCRFTPFCECIVSEKVSGTDQDDSETSSREAMSCCYVNRMRRICSISNRGGGGAIVTHFEGDGALRF
jgi:hypothetical protein